ncbi:Uncharacterised protein [Mycobacterium tuberculosis]|nr:Uncharacterised protein [Mycobacterium tuberculosis]
MRWATSPVSSDASGPSSTRSSQPCTSSSNARFGLCHEVCHAASRIAFSA